MREQPTDWLREDLTVAITRAIGDRKTAEALTAAYYRATKDARHTSGEKHPLSAVVDRCVAAYRELTARP